MNYGIDLLVWIILGFALWLVVNLSLNVVSDVSEARATARLQVERRPWDEPFVPVNAEEVALAWQTFNQRFLP